MLNPLPADVRQQRLAQLNNLLEMYSIQLLRQAARLWGWSLRGTAKAEVVGQMLTYLSDANRMAEAFAELPEDEREVLHWLKVLQPTKPISRPIQAALEASRGSKITQKGIDALVEDLGARCLVFPTLQGHQVPELYEEWLPGLAAEKLRYDRQPVAVTSFSLADLSNHIQHLLLNIRHEEPVLTFYRPLQRDYPTGTSTPPAAVARPCPVATPTLNAWGYLTKEERQLAHFLIEAFLAGGVCYTHQTTSTQFLKTRTPQGAELLEKEPAQQLAWLRGVWQAKITGQVPLGLNVWTEADLALQHVPGRFRLAPSAYWGTQEQLAPLLAMLHKWLASLVTGLRADVWYSTASLCALIYRLRPNLLLTPEKPMFTWYWYQDGKPLDPAHMSLEDWQDTYGKLVEAWLASTATWMLIAEVGYEAGRPVAFRRYAQIPRHERSPLPSNAVKVTADDVVVVQNIPRTGRLRQIMGSIAVETQRERATTTYRLAPLKFRDLLLQGITADRLKEAFASTGYTLDHKLAEQLESWQARAGQEQIYERVAVIEFNEAVHPTEVAAIAASLNVGPIYAISPRCLVLLNPDAVQYAVAQLRQRGYTPRVIA